jgi:lysophospholipase
MSVAATQTVAPPELSEAYFPSKDGTQLYMASMVPAGAKAAVLVLHGYSDHALRYRNVMDALSQAGFAAHALDYRGHGRASGKRGFVANFADYTDDLTAALNRIRAASGTMPLFIIAHSHGALVAATLLASPSAPKDVAGLVLSSPYFRLRIVPTAFQLFQAKWVGKVLPSLAIKSPLTSDMLTHDKAFVAETDKDPLKHNIVTPRWFTESNAAQEALFRNASRFTLPLLVMPGGDDPVADPSGAKQFVESAGSKDKTLTVYPGMFHEIFNEVEKEKPIAEAVAWIDAHLGGRA